MIQHIQPQTEKSAKTYRLFKKFQYIVSLVLTDHNEIILAAKVLQMFPPMAVGTCAFSLPDIASGLLDLFKRLQPDIILAEVAQLDLGVIVEGFRYLTEPGLPRTPACSG